MVVANHPYAQITENSIQVSWPDTLNIVREFGAKATQRELNFRFRPEGVAAERLQAFSKEVQHARAAQTDLAPLRTEAEIETELRSLGFTKRKLKPFQLRDLARLLTLSNGANFSVPGAGKTTVTFALHLLTRKSGYQTFYRCAQSRISGVARHR